MAAAAGCAVFVEREECSWSAFWAGFRAFKFCSRDFVFLPPFTGFVIFYFLFCHGLFFGCLCCFWRFLSFGRLESDKKFCVLIDVGNNAGGVASVICIDVTERDMLWRNIQVMRDCFFDGCFCWCRLALMSPVKGVALAS